MIRARTPKPGIARKPWPGSAKVATLRQVTGTAALGRMPVIHAGHGLARRSPIRVFVVSDSGDIRDGATRCLGNRGMAVAVASGPDGLVQKIHRFRPDVVVIDHFFRQSRRGYVDLMPALVERFPAIRYIVALEGTPSKDQVMDALRWGASDVVLRDTMHRDRTLERAVVNAARA